MRRAAPLPKTKKSGWKKNRRYRWCVCLRRFIIFSFAVVKEVIVRTSPSHKQLYYDQRVLSGIASSKKNGQDLAAVFQVLGVEALFLLYSSGRISSMQRLQKNCTTASRASRNKTLFCKIQMRKMQPCLLLVPRVPTQIKLPVVNIILVIVSY